MVLKEFCARHKMFTIVMQGFINLNRLVGMRYGIQPVGQEGTATWRLEYAFGTS
jgi:hypothetical protein